MAQTGSWLPDLINDQHVVAVAMKCLYYNYADDNGMRVAQTLKYF